MTVIAYVKGTLYADRLHHLNIGDIVEKKHLRSKVYINADKTIAFAYTGSEVREDSVDSIFKVLFTVLELDNKIQGVSTSKAHLNDDCVKTVLQPDVRRYFVITRSQALMIDESGMVHLDKEDLVTGGVDASYFKALYLAGMKPQVIIPHIHDNITHTSSREFDTVRQCDLKTLKFIELIVDPGQAVKNLERKLQALKENA